MIVKEIVYGSDLYLLSVAFREEILRIPQGLVMSEKDLENENFQTHIAALDDEKNIMGTVVLKYIAPKQMKLRQMAIYPALQGTGIGCNLMNFAEDFAKNAGCERMEMTARVSAQDFYKKFGYETVGEPFKEVRINVTKMERQL